jgi:hypothetical protein
MVEGCNAGVTTPMDNAHYTLQSGESAMTIYEVYSYTGPKTR